MRFYKLLAMRQVFTIPQSEFLTRSNFLRFVPKAIPWLPCALLLSIIIHDFVTINIGLWLESVRFFVEQTLSTLVLIIILRISFVVAVRMVWMDDIWDVVYDFSRAHPRNLAAVAERWDEVFHRNHKDLAWPRLRRAKSREEVTIQAHL